MHQLKIVSITARVPHPIHTEPIQIKSSAALRMGLVRDWLAEIETLVTRIETTISMCEKSGCGKDR